MRMQQLIRTTTAPGVWALRNAAAFAARRVLPEDSGHVPDGRMLDLPGRGSTFVIDVPGPTEDAPVVVLLHALGTTAYLSWAATLEELSTTHRVITFDLRWHGRGIRSEQFRFADCADDAVAVLDRLGVDQAIVAGYSIGGAIAQLVWHRHPDRVAGLVLCSTARNYRGAHRERLFFPVLTGITDAIARHAHRRVEQAAARLPDIPSLDRSDPLTWGRTEFRSTSAWSFPHIVAELGRFNSAGWISEVDVPTAVVITTSDHTIPERRQRRLAACIPGATVHEVSGGHASIVLGASTWVPRFRAALDDVTSRLSPPAPPAHQPLLASTRRR